MEQILISEAQSCLDKKMHRYYSKMWIAFAAVLAKSTNQIGEANFIQAFVEFAVQSCLSVLYWGGRLSSPK